MKQEMETDDDHATMRESFSLVQSKLFIAFKPFKLDPKVITMMMTAMTMRRVVRL